MTSAASNQPKLAQPKPTSKSNNKVVDAAAFVLHRYAYKETSLVCELFTLEHGRIVVVAKGARRPHSALRATLVPFHGMLATWSGQGELKLLQKAEWSAAPLGLSGNAVMSAFYLNECLLRMLALADPHPDLFKRYANSLALLADGQPIALVLRSFEWGMLSSLGLAFDPTVTHEGQAVDPRQRYVWLPGTGLELATAYNTHEHSLTIMGYALLALAQEQFDDAQAANSIKTLLRALLHYHMDIEHNRRPLKTRQVFEQLQSFLPQ